MYNKIMMQQMIDQKRQIVDTESMIIFKINMML